MRSKILLKIAHMVIRAPWAVVITAAIITALSLWLALTRLEIHTDQDDLVSEKLEYHHQYKEYLRDFGDQEYIYVVVEAKDNLPRAKQFTRTLAKRLEDLPEIKEVTYRISNPALERSFLLYLPAAQLTQIENFLSTPPTSVKDISTWGDLTPIFRAMNGAISKPADESRRQELTMGFTFISQLLDGMLNSMQSGGTYKSTLQSLFFGDDQQFDEEGYLLSENGKFLFIMIMPAKNYTTLAVIDKPLKEIRGALDLTRGEFPDVRAGLTGRPVLAADEMSISNRDMTIATILALAAVTILFMLYFKKLTRPLMAVTALTMGIAWTFGLTTLTIGYLNILSIVFAVILVGAGIEFGLQIVARYREELEAHHNVRLAIETCVSRTGKGNLTACFTTAAAFFSATLTDFLALKELGFIAGSGILLCLLSMFTVLPALMYIWDRKRHKTHLHTTILIRLDFLEKIYRRPNATLGLLLVATIILLPQLGKIRFDHNLLNLQARGLESVEYEKKIIENSNQSTWYAIFTSQTEAESEAYAERLKSLASIGRIETIQTIVPPYQTEKKEIILRLKRAFEGVRYAPISATIPVESLTHELRLLESGIERISDQAFKSGYADAVTELESLNTKLAQIRNLIKLRDPATFSRLAAFQGAFLIDFQHKLELLSTGLRPTKITIDDMPETIRRRFVSSSGRLAIYAYPKFDVWEPDLLENFVKDLRSIDPSVLGVPIEVYESSKLMQKSFKMTAFYASLLICLILVLDFKNLKHAALAFAPLGAGMLWLFELMGFFNIPFNLANFFSIPIFLGVGVDNGVQVIHRFKQEGSGSRIMTRSTGTAVLLTSLTTFCSFAAMLISSHRGIFSLGLIMSLGTLTCLVGSMVLLPAMLKKVGK